MFCGRVYTDRCGSEGIILFVSASAALSLKPTPQLGLTHYRRQRHQSVAAISSLLPLSCCPLAARASAPIVCRWVYTPPPSPLFLRVSGCQSAGSNLIPFFDFTFYHGKANPNRKLADEFRRLQSHKLDTITAKCLAMTEQPHYLLISALNVRSLAAHAKDVHHDHILRHSSVLCFAETWMDPEEPLEIIDFLYCCGARRDHNRAAGVAIYLRTGLSAIPVEMFGTSHEVGELCAAKLPNGLLVVAAYFASTALTKDVVHFLQLALTVHRSTPMLVVGDFNVDIKTNSNFLTLMRENIPFLSLVTRPTAVTTSRGTCIDLVFENQALVYQVEHISVYFSDHKASFMTVKNC
ncbi:uncharacterized protein [Dermacentor andersoni]|uniref:uncharacterized protein n=1 Tax=Dermacentor andersoni TaxID=34620 RepID=UPI003B3AB117